MATISITYNNLVIATLTAGQGVSLSCGSTKMASDIIIESQDATATVVYKNETIARLAENEKVTLYCKDQIAQTNIIVRNTSIPEEPEQPTNQLPAPVIELDGTTLNIYDESGLAEEFDILVDGQVKETVEAVPFEILNPLNGATLSTSLYEPGDSVSYQYQLNKPANSVSLEILSEDGENKSGEILDGEAIITFGYGKDHYIECRLNVDGLFKIKNEGVIGDSMPPDYEIHQEEITLTFTDHKGVSIKDVVLAKGMCYMCFVKNTLITLEAGRTKLVQDINYDDDLLVWDFDKGCYSYAKPLWIMKTRKSNCYYKLTFDNSETLSLVNRGEHVHRIFCVDTNRFEYANDCVGKSVMTRNGVVKLLSCEKVDEVVDYYNIITDYHMNLYANNVLTSTGFSNIYPVKDMKYVMEERPLIPIEAFDNCPEKYYYGFRLGEQVEYTIEEINKKIRRIAENAVENWN